ncbi:MAG: glutamate formiminotransferase [Acidimicrobiia bacterium]
MFECVINVSEGIDESVLDALRIAAGIACVDLHADPDHHRSVFTLAHPECAAIETAARDLTTAAYERLDLRTHTGVHPRFGIVDVVPFVTLSEDEDAQRATVAAAHAYATWASTTHGVPCFLYGTADMHARTLPEVRREAFTVRVPDCGPNAPDPQRGAIAVGVRPPMIAVNVELASNNLDTARTIARQVRGRDGGLPGVRALAFALASREHVQVSMNLVDLSATGMQAACAEVADAAHERGVEVDRIELVGLMPWRELARCEPWFVEWAELTEHHTIEARVNARADARPGS